MTEKTTNPFDEQAVTPEEEMVPEVITHEASDTVMVGGKITVGGILMKPNFTVALSETNKRYLDKFELITDYVGADPKLWETYGVPEEKRAEVMLLKNVDVMPLDFVIAGYDKLGEASKYPEPVIGCCLKDGTLISREEAIKVLADWFYDHYYTVDFYEEMMEYEDIEDAIAFADVSEEDLEYGKEMSSDDEWELLECATLHLMATSYVDDLVALSSFVYTYLAERYEEAGVILVDTRFSFGIDDECNVGLCGEIGTPDVSTMASKELHGKNGDLTDMVEAPILKYFQSIAYAGEKGSTVPEIPEDVLDDVSDTCMYLAEALCDDLSFELNL